MTFGAPGSASIRPTVATCVPGVVDAMRFAASVSSAAVTSASRLRFIGVVPAWFATPSTVTSHQRMPTMPSTTPMSMPDFVEDRALLDMKLDECGDRPGCAARLSEARGIATDCADAIADLESAVTDDVERGSAQAAGHRLAADRAAFLVGEDDELEGMARRDAVRAQQLRHLDGAEHADIAVVVAALRNGVDVGARHDHGQRRVRALAASDDVSGRVDAHVEPGVPHQRLHVFPAGDVGGAERDAAHAAFGVGAEAAELMDAALEAGGVGPRQRVGCECSRDARDHGNADGSQAGEHEAGKFDVAWRFPRQSACSAPAVHLHSECTFGVGQPTGARDHGECPL